MSFPESRLEQDCPCGSELAYQVCCRPFHTAHKAPSTAEQLMRSRYSAYYFRLVDYLVGSQHPDTREPGLRKELGSTVHQVAWRGLEILGVSKGTSADKQGKVEFVARYSHNGEPGELHERSRFRRYKGKWKYYDGRG